MLQIASVKPKQKHLYQRRFGVSSCWYCIRYLFWSRPALMFSLFCKGRANGLRIDAVEGECANRKGQYAAASVRVERSRIWKKKPGTSGKKIIRTQNPPTKRPALANRSLCFTKLWNRTAHLPCGCRPMQSKCRKQAPGVQNYGVAVGSGPANGIPTEMRRSALNACS